MGYLSINNIENYKLNSKSNFINTDKYFKECLMLPLNTIISNNELRYVIESIKKFYE